MSKVVFSEMPYSGAHERWDPEWHSKELFTWEVEPHPFVRTQNCDPMRGEDKFKWPKYLLRKDGEYWAIYVAEDGQVRRLLPRFDDVETAVAHCSEREEDAEVADFIEELLFEWSKEEGKDGSR